MNSRTLPRFWRLYRGLPESVRQAARDAYRQFMADPTHPGLRFHRLDYDPRLWSVRVTRNYRAVGIRDGDTITWIWIGSHELYFARFPHTRTPKTAEKMRGPSNNGPFGGFGKPAQKAANP